MGVALYDTSEVYGRWSAIACGCACERERKGYTIDDIVSTHDTEVHVLYML